MLEVTHSVDTLLRRIQSKSALVGVIGLGYVGLPLSIALAEGGCRVLGFDVDPAKTQLISNGRSYIKHIASERLATLHQDGLLSATSDMGRLDEPDAILICVPTPLTRHFEPDLSFVTRTAEAIAERL